jgi:hypothetical protein
MKTLIIQTSPKHTASTLLINILYGLIPELNNKKVIGIWHDNFEKYFDNIIVIKCHHLDIDELILIFRTNYNLYFICSERQEKKYLIDEKYKLYNNVIVFDFNELNENEENTITEIVNNIYNKINKKINLEMDIQGGINRVISMNKRYEEIKHLPFKYVDNFFEIHGSHRNRIN